MPSDGVPRPAGAPVDPRPLVGEPASLDLLNTVWIDEAGRHDLLRNLQGLAVWLSVHGLAARAPRTQVTRLALIQARTAIAAHVRAPDDAGAVEAINAVLAHGVLARTLTAQGPTLPIRIDDLAHLPAWPAADYYLQLLARDPSRIRRCAHPDCVLYFYDTSPKGNRRWCSMAGCGNRAKAARHYARIRRQPQS